MSQCNLLRFVPLLMLPMSRCDVRGLQKQKNSLVGFPNSSCVTRFNEKNRTSQLTDEKMMRCARPSGKATKSQTISALHLVEREEQKHWTWCSLKTSQIDYSSRLCNETFRPCVEFQNFVAKPFNAFECDRISHNFFAVTWSHVNADLHYKTDELQNEKCENFHAKIERTLLSGWVTTRHCNDQTIPAINHQKFCLKRESEKFWRKQNSRERNKFINHDDIVSVLVRVLRNQMKIEVNSKSI